MDPSSPPPMVPKSKGLKRTYGFKNLRKALDFDGIE
jgi:hypothetical protein